MTVGLSWDQMTAPSTCQKVGALPSISVVRPIVNLVVVFLYSGFRLPLSSLPSFIKLFAMCFAVVFLRWGRGPLCGPNISLSLELHASVSTARSKCGYSVATLICLWASIVNFPSLNGDVPRRTSYGVYISQFIRFARASSNLSDFKCRNKALTAKLLRLGYRYFKLRKASS